MPGSLVVGLEAALLLSSWLGCQQHCEESTDLSHWPPAWCSARCSYCQPCAVHPECSTATWDKDAIGMTAKMGLTKSCWISSKKKKKKVRETLPNGCGEYLLPFAFYLPHESSVFNISDLNLISTVCILKFEATKACVWPWTWISPRRLLLSRCLNMFWGGI